MSFSRLKYDVCEQKKLVEESVGPGLYQIQTPIQCTTCFQENPELINQHGGVSMNSGVEWRFYAGPVDVESELRNINRPYSRCPDKKYEPRCANCKIIVSGQPCGPGITPVCFDCKEKLKKRGQRCEDNDLVDFPDCHFPIENTRLSNPPCTLRGTGWNRFDPLCLDPQDQIFFPGDYYIPTRTIFKDNHRPCIPKPAINSMDPVYKPMKCPETAKTCGTFTDPLYFYEHCY